MPLSAEQELKHIGETKASADHDHDLVQELSRRLDSVWRYDQYIANAEGHDDLRSLWQRCKKDDLKIVEELKQIIAGHIKKDCF